MKRLTLITGLLLTLFSCSEPEAYKSVVSTEVAGTVIGTSIETDSVGYDLKFFELQDVSGATYKFRYCNTPLRIGDSIKYTSPKTSNPADLGSIMHYGRSRSHGQVHKLY